MKRLSYRLVSIFLVIMLLFLPLFTACSDKETDSKTSATPTSSESTPKVNATTSAATQTLTAEETSAPSETEKPATSNADYKIVYGSAEIDGSIDDSWDKAEVVNLEYLKTGVLNDDTEVEARVMWDEKGLYFFFEVIDSSISTNNDIGHWENDSIYLYVDESMDYVYSFEEFTGGVRQFALLPNDKELIPRYGDALNGDDYKYACKMTDDGMFIEFFYKPTEVEMKAGTEMYMDFQYNDCTGSARDGALGWYNDTDSNAISELWGLVELMEKGVEVK